MKLTEAQCQDLTTMLAIELYKNSMSIEQIAIIIEGLFTSLLKEDYPVYVEMMHRQCKKIEFGTFLPLCTTTTKEK